MLDDFLFRLNSVSGWLVFPAIYIVAVGLLFGAPLRHGWQGWVMVIGAWGVIAIAEHIQGHRRKRLAYKLVDLNRAYDIRTFEYTMAVCDAKDRDNLAASLSYIIGHADQIYGTAMDILLSKPHCVSPAEEASMAMREAFKMVSRDEDFNVINPDSQRWLRTIFETKEAKFRTPALECHRLRKTIYVMGGRTSVTFLKKNNEKTIK